MNLTNLLMSEAANCGWSVAIENDTAVIGTPFRAKSGAAYILKFDGTNWIQSTKLLASDGEIGDQFGTSVAISGNTVIVGAPKKAEAAGAAYIYKFDGTDWIETKLTVSDGAAGDNFGASVAISGKTAIVGASGKYEAAGAAYIYKFDGMNWIQSKKLLASDDEPGDRFGASVAICGDTGVIGAPYKSNKGFGGTGAAYIYSLNWIQSTKLLASDGELGDRFGWSVAISGDTVIVGAPSKFNNGFDTGAAYIYKFNGTNWIQSNKLLASDAAIDDCFGYSVAVSGNTAIIGAPYRRNDAGVAAGAYIYKFDGTDWIETKLLVGGNDIFGRLAAVSGI